MAKDQMIDADIVHQIVVEEELIENPYATLDKLVEKLNDIKPYLVNVAREGRSTTYIETAHNTGVFTARQSRVLGILGLHEDKLGNPLLPAVVVQSNDDPMVGGKYFNMVKVARNYPDEIPEPKEERRALWERHLQEVHDYWN